MHWNNMGREPQLPHNLYGVHYTIKRQRINITLYLILHQTQFVLNEAMSKIL